ncbi:Flp pilus assembly complex ATPase component TadA [Alicyclobacillus tolerans]|uniref:ATPase, T2SS/T4P/T4SS family n=1 Tax=Alicyclobacillus tolerans TaxID=90970 RepID=UPI001F22ABDD|nr:ATPase, T2SS/T4P/T4SS family [Alicyclobacillus tolerans]MCF8567439.1 Flp pilus assembly complex ATPase component TadA [Alicyclobacillus tolerans]
MSLSMEEILAQIQQNSTSDLAALIHRSEQIRQHYRGEGERNIPLLERQRDILIDYLYRKDLDFLRSAPSEDETRARLAKAIQQGEVERLAVNAKEAIEAVITQMYRHGILQPLMDESRPDITDVWVFGTYGVQYRVGGINHWFVDDQGERIRFKTIEELHRYVERKLGADFHLDLSAPSVNAIFPDGSRIIYRDKAIGISTWIDGKYVLFQGEPILVIRRFGHPFSLDELMATGMFTRRMRAYLELIPKIRDSFLIGGPTGAGKSTLQNAMLESLPQTELTAILEDTPDAKARGGFYVRLYTQEANGEDKGEITIARNLFDSKRMNFQNAIVNEMRDGQAAIRAADVAMMTSGLFSSTIHAIGPEKMVKVYINMLRSAPERPSEEYAMDLFATSFQQLVSIELEKDGDREDSPKKPKITTIAEVMGSNGNRVEWRPVFELKYSTNQVIFHGLSERMIERAYKYKVPIPPELQQPGVEDL